MTLSYYLQHTSDIVIHIGTTYGEGWLIVETKWGRVFDRKTGDFIRETEHSEVVAIVNADNTVEYK